MFGSEGSADFVGQRRHSFADLGLDVFFRPRLFRLLLRLLNLLRLLLGRCNVLFLVLSLLLRLQQIMVAVGVSRTIHLE